MRRERDNNKRKENERIKEGGREERVGGTLRGFGNHIAVASLRVEVAIASAPSRPQR